MATTAIPAPAPSGTTAWHALTVKDALDAQHVNEAVGLSAAEVESRQAAFGLNKFADAPKEPRRQVFLRQYADPMQVVLLGAGILSFFIPGQVPTGVLLILLTLLNAYLGMSQEGKAEASVAAL
ncbi:MAG: ATPase, partial [Chloroflexi bacterium]